MELRAQRASSPLSTMTRSLQTFQKPALALLMACVMAGPAIAQSMGSSQTASENSSDLSGPVRLSPATRGTQDTSAQQQQQQQQQAQSAMTRAPKYVPGEFEIYVNKLLGIDLTDPLTLEQLRRADTGLGGRGAGRRHLVEHPALVRGVPLDGLDEVRDEVVPALQLGVDLTPGLLDEVPEPDQAVVLRHRPQQHEHDDDGDDDQGEGATGHGSGLPSVGTVTAW